MCKALWHLQNFKLMPKDHDLGNPNEGEVVAIIEVEHVEAFDEGGGFSSDLNNVVIE